MDTVVNKLKLRPIKSISSLNPIGKVPKEKILKAPRGVRLPMKVGRVKMNKMGSY